MPKPATKDTLVSTKKTTPQTRAKTPQKVTATKNSPKDRQFVTALARGLNVLRCFDAEHTELGSVDLAKMTGLPQSTVWRLCHTLVACGFLVPCDRGDKLQIGAPILSLGYGALSAMGFDQTLEREMKRLAVDFDAAVSLGVRDGNDMIITQRAKGNGVLLINLHVGSRMPLMRSSFGWGYLALLDEAERENVLREHLPKSASEKQLLRKHINVAMHDYETNGYVINCGIFHKEINAIAIPFWDPQRKQIYVINCGAPAQVLPESLMRKKVAARLQEVVHTAMAAQAAKTPG